MSHFTFLLPDVGEGLTEAEIVSWRVQPGDEVSVNQVVCEIETAKSLVELPSPFQGVVKELLVNEGDTVLVGTPIISVEGEGGDSAPDTGVTDAVGDAESSVTQETAEPKNLVGYGTGPTTPTSRRKRAQSPADAPVVTPAPAVGTDLPLAESVPVIAKPPIRKLAKDLGVILDSVTGSGIGGEILRDDVIRHAGQARSSETLQPRNGLRTARTESQSKVCAKLLLRRW